MRRLGVFVATVVAVVAVLTDWTGLDTTPFGDGSQLFVVFEVPTPAFSSLWFEYALPRSAFALLAAGAVAAWLARRLAPRAAKVVTCVCAAVSLGLLAVFAISVARHPVLTLGAGYWLAAASSSALLAVFITTPARR